MYAAETSNQGSLLQLTMACAAIGHAAAWPAERSSQHPGKSRPHHNISIRPEPSPVPTTATACTLPQCIFLEDKVAGCEERARDYEYMVLSLSDMLSLERENTEEACLALHNSHRHGLELESQVGVSRVRQGAHAWGPHERGTSV